jgi:hypothetical protein
MESEARISKHIVLRACPVADGKGPCSRSCGGGWPGTKATTEKLTKALHNGGVDPDRLGCGPLVERARVAVFQIRETKA